MCAQFLYDLVFEKEDPKFKGASKTHRDTKNKTMLSTQRTVGGQMTSSLLAYQVRGRGGGRWEGLGGEGGWKGAAAAAATALGQLGQVEARLGSCRYACNMSGPASLCKGAATATATATATRSRWGAP